MKRKTMLTRMNILVYLYEYKALTHDIGVFYMGITPCRCLVYRDILAIYIIDKSLTGS